jgi:ABC-type multidrug transport system ATPase subunit
VVFASQQLDEIERHAGRVVELRDGRLVFAGTVDEYDRPSADTLSA